MAMHPGKKISPLLLFGAIFLITLSLLPALAGCGEEEEPPATDETVTAEATVPTVPTATRTTPAPEPNTLLSQKIAGPIQLNATSPDPAWADAPALTLRLTGGDYFDGGATDMTIQSLYTSQEIFFRVQWTDLTESLISTPMVKQADGSWHLGVPRPNFEDSMAFIWNINDSIAGFNTSGCAVACHPGEGIPIGGFLGKMYTPGPGQYGDLWQWSAPRTDTYDLDPAVSAFVDDWAIDDYSEVIVEVREASAGRFPDPGDAPFTWNVTPGNTSPQFQWQVKPTDYRYVAYLWNDNLAPFVDVGYQPGDWVPVFIMRNATGDRADLPADVDRSERKWTIEFRRKLVTGSTADPPVDIQFASLGRIYYFGVMAIDNGLMHATYPEPLMLRFSP